MANPVLKRLTTRIMLHNCNTPAISHLSVITSQEIFLMTVRYTFVSHNQH